RIVLDHPAVRVGFPEVSLGLFPGGGGTQRLPRIIGIQAALPIILEGKPMPVHAALEVGLVDGLGATSGEIMKKARKWIHDNPESVQPWDSKGFHWPGGAPNSPALAKVWMMSSPMLNQKTRNNYPAQRYALAAIYEGSLVDFDTADRIESRYFAKTVSGQVAKNMINAFWFQMNDIKKGASRPQDIPPSKIAKVGILGAGMMGAGVAWAAASCGIDVVLKDVTLEQAEKGKVYSEKLLEKKIKRGHSSAEKAEAVLNRIHPTADAADMAGCDLVIEAVFENRDLKAKVTRETEAVIPEHAVFASNTSTLPITGLAEASQRPDQFIGLHFFSPVDKMQLVEIITGKQTSPKTLAAAFDFVLAIKKVPIVVEDSRGFYTSRVFSTYVNEGLALLNEGQQPRAVESAGLKAGMPVGPLALSDEVSLSLMHHVASQTKADLGADYQPGPGDAVIMKMVEGLDRPGKKAAKGFYEYPDDQPKFLWPGLAEAFPRSEETMSQAEMVDRLLFVQAVETVRCMEEKILSSSADANIGSILGWGFAPFHGGTLQFINAYGLEAFTTRAGELADRYGDRFRPPALLEEMVEQGQTF
nr:3-hydroxyacyl-CoA dehydrogenase NAD-binding domain-containing protein [Acidobacteriota bacterium]